MKYFNVKEFAPINSPVNFAYVNQAFTLILDTKVTKLYKVKS